MFSIFDNGTLNLVNMAVSLVFAILVLLIKLHFPKMFKGALAWFLSLLLPGISFLLLFLNRSYQSHQVYLNIQQIMVVGLCYLLGNILLQIGWLQFYNDASRIHHYISLLIIPLFIPLLLIMLKIPLFFIFNIFDCVIFLYLEIYLVKKYRSNNSYSSVLEITLYFFAFLTTLFPLVLFGTGFLDSPEILGIILPLSYMFRNTFVLFSIYIIVMHRFKVDHEKILEEKMELMKELEILSETDALTGLYNRRGFDNFINYEYKQAKREKIGATITLCDIDFFKKINDTYGHDCGDYVIQTISSLISKNIREQDCLARWGGEEFIIMQKGDSLETAKSVMERVRKQIEELKLTYDNQTFSVTMSFGIAPMPGKNVGYDTALIDADTKLYKAKQSGRNCIVA